MKNNFINKTFLLFLCLFVFFSCDSDSVVGNVKTEELFSLKYGNFED